MTLPPDSFPDPHATSADPDVGIDLSQPQAVHVIGVGGAAMNPIARVLSTMGHRVSGSDQRESGGLGPLRDLGITVTVPHGVAALPVDVDVVVVSTAIPADNAELTEARRRGVPVCSRARAQAAIAALRTTVAIAGTHGKTTTSSMLAMILMEAGRQPSFIIGGEVTQIGTGAQWHDTDLFVIEADESDGTFIELPRHLALVTNVEPDHLEHWGDFEHLRAAFEIFLIDATGPRVVCVDDEGAAAIGRSVGAITFGTSESADYRMIEVSAGRDGVDFVLEHKGEPLGAIRVPLAGMHNARNAAGAVVAALLLDAPFDVCRTAIAAFGGAGRRYEHRGEINGITFIDDYAHLPTEVAAMLAAAQDGEWGRVVCVFQPHRYSRTASLWPTFVDAFEGADILVVTDIYPSGEAPRPGVSGVLIVHAVLDAHAWRRVVYLPDRNDLVSFLVGELRADDLCLTLGAGDLTTLPDEVQARLQPVST